MQKLRASWDKMSERGLNQLVEKRSSITIPAWAMAATSLTHRFLSLSCMVRQSNDAEGNLTPHDFKPIFIYMMKEVSSLVRCHVTIWETIPTLISELRLKWQMPFSFPFLPTHVNTNISINSHILIALDCEFWADISTIQEHRERSHDYRLQDAWTV